ncbi:hypothetical protein QRQ56_30665 [Bradyrhizobium sp. U531]|uniref:hypothetical protein n=1 Tax=Bradyrhizobium sp. U531 TaxID=3053458 RepID=UPI003F429DF8
MEQTHELFDRLAINFRTGIGIAEVVVRGSIMYLCMFAILRFVGRRQAGHFGPADLLVIVMIAHAAQNGLGKDYSSVTEGVVLVLTIVCWKYFLGWLSFKFLRAPVTEATGSQAYSKRLVGEK